MKKWRDIIDLAAFRLGDHKQDILFWAKFVGVLVGGYGIYQEAGLVTAICGFFVAYHVALIHKTVKSHSEKIRELRRLP